MACARLSQSSRPQHELAIGFLAAEAAGLRTSLAQLTHERVLDQQQQLSVATMAMSFQQQADQHAAEAAEAHILCAQQQQALEFMQQQQASAEIVRPAAKQPDPEPGGQQESTCSLD